MKTDAEQSKQDFYERSNQRRFVKQLEAVSISLAVWAQQKIDQNTWSIEDVKVSIRNAMIVCERD